MQDNALDNVYIDSIFHSRIHSMIPSVSQSVSQSFIDLWFIPSLIDHSVILSLVDRCIHSLIG